jgi:hypothetical protein
MLFCIAYQLRKSSNNSQLLRDSSCSEIPSFFHGMLSRIHNGHVGIQGCLRRAKESLYWPRMYRDIENVVRNCESGNVHILKWTSKRAVNTLSIWLGIPRRTCYMYEFVSFRKVCKVTWTKLRSIVRNNLAWYSMSWKLCSQLLNNMFRCCEIPDRPWKKLGISEQELSRNSWLLFELFRSW